MKQSLKETFDLAVSLAGTARTNSANGTGVDLANYAQAVVCVVPVSYTDGSHALKVEESDDNTNFTQVDASQLDGTMPTLAGAGDASVITRVGYLGSKRYIRAVATVTGTSSGAVYSAHVLRASPRKAPK